MPNALTPQRAAAHRTRFPRRPSSRCLHRAAEV